MWSETVYVTKICFIPDAIVYQWNVKTKEIESKIDIMEVVQNQNTSRIGKIINSRKTFGGECQFVVVVSVKI